MMICTWGRSLSLEWGRFENNKRPPYFCNEARGGWLLQTKKPAKLKLKVVVPNKNQSKAAKKAGLSCGSC